MEKKPTKKELKQLEQKKLLREVAEIEKIINENIESSSLKDELLFCVAELKKTAFSYKELIRLADLVACANFKESYFSIRFTQKSFLISFFFLTFLLSLYPLV